MVSIITSAMLLISWGVLIISNPISLGGYLLLLSILSSVLLGLLYKSWFFYFLALVFLGGVMVVILFMVSVCSNKKFISVNKEWLLFTIVLLLLISSQFNLNSINFSSVNISLSLFSKSSMVLFLFMMVLLILCMINVISLSKLEKGPLVKRL